MLSILLLSPGKQSPRGLYTSWQCHSRLASAALTSASSLGHLSLEFLLPLSHIASVITRDCSAGCVIPAIRPAGAEEDPATGRGWSRVQGQLAYWQK